MTDLQPWEPLVDRELDEDHVPRLRISGSGHCVRRQAYVFLRKPETDPPDRKAKNRMALGKMAEVLIVRDLKERGWETAHTVLDSGGQLEVKVEIPGAGFFMTGHPDGICRHPEFTAGKWVTLECKSMGASWAEEAEARGIAETYPRYIPQIALYGRRLYEMEKTAHPERGVFAIMDREGENLPVQRIRWEPEVYEETVEKIARVMNETTEENLPERPYAPESMECRFCPYRTLCWGDGFPKPGRSAPPRKVPIDGDPRVIQAARTWADLKPQMDEAVEVLQRASNGNGKMDIECEGVTAGYFTPREDPVYDVPALRRMVPQDVLERCMSRYQPEKKRRFWVRFSRKR